MTINTHINNTNTNASILNFDLSSSMKIVRWDTITALQPEKVEILLKWFELTKGNSSLNKTTTPVVDVNTGIVYMNSALGFSSKDHSQYTSIRYLMVKAVTNNQPYGYKFKDFDRKAGENQKDIFGNNIMGHRFVSVVDVSATTLKALYDVYTKNNAHTLLIPKENDKKDIATQYRRSNPDYDLAGNLLSREIKELEKEYKKLTKEYSKTVKWQRGKGAIKLQILSVEKEMKAKKLELKKHLVYNEGKVIVTKKMAEHIKLKYPSLKVCTILSIINEAIYFTSENP